jgi:hypothetical protein
VNPSLQGVTFINFRKSEWQKVQSHHAQVAISCMPKKALKICHAESSNFISNQQKFRTKMFCEMAFLKQLFLSIV